MRISDWSSDVCSADLLGELFRNLQADPPGPAAHAIEDDIWAIWIAHDDPHLENRMQQAIGAIAQRRFAYAETQLNDLVAAAPEWAETWNKRATLYYLERKSVAEGKSVYVRVNLGGRRVKKKKK